MAAWRFWRGSGDVATTISLSDARAVTGVHANGSTPWSMKAEELAYTAHPMNLVVVIISGS